MLFRGNVHVFQSIFPLENLIYEKIFQFFTTTKKASFEKCDISLLFRAMKNYILHFKFTKYFHFALFALKKKK